MKLKWWKITCIVLLVYSFIAGFVVDIPYIGNLYQTIRNFYFHVPMWFGMITLLTLSLVYSIAYLRTGNLKHDIYAVEFVKTGIIFGILGLVTGAIWARFTWGEYWSNDPRQITAAIAILIYFAYLILRGTLTDMDKRARISGVYNVFAFFIYIPLMMILPRMVQSLHPGGLEGPDGAGNPGLGGGSLDPAMRSIFFSAVIGWILFGLWISTLKVRYFLITHKNIFDVKG